MTHQEKLHAIRSMMALQQIDAYIIPSADPHMSEYVPDHYKCIHFASGFSGSAGTLVITQNFAGLWADFRYFEQAELQLAGSGFELVKLQVQHTPEYIDWLYETLPDGATVAFDFTLLSIVIAEQLKQQLDHRSISIKNADLLSLIWSNRPALSHSKAHLLKDEDCGRSVAEKLGDLRLNMGKYKATLHLISTLDDIAWLFNIRGSDVSYNPVVLSFALITQTEATLYIQTEKLSNEDKNALQMSCVSVAQYNEVDSHLTQIAAGSCILLDEKRTCYQFLTLIPPSVRVIKDTNPVVFLKSIKNPVEIANMRSAMITDGVALTRFFKWLEENIGGGNVSEISASERVKAFREEGKGFAGLSFGSIAGYQAHAALPHYCPDDSSNTLLLSEGLFLLDSGGHYYYGTTDVTRTVPLGNNTNEEKRDYTLVLSAMITGSAAKFPKGTRGYQIDSLCRKQLWEFNINYGHGTGHGVGYYLNVHEGPQNIGPANAAVAMAPGMITSIEPGIYRPGKHGVRIENLVLTVKGDVSEFGEFLKFETITLAHIDTTLVITDLLQPKQIQWLNSYNQLVFEKLSPLLKPDECEWLSKKCQPI
ncbi:MAG: aminopeptidase P family protein [Mucilaginibacter sp.]|uniref:aminopeptidase P family protein n=1 Tax=Mucilaginibacter sp. TaxID=1882438 RepID=UPI00326423A0